MSATATFDVFHHDSEGKISQRKTTREIGPHSVLVEISHSGLCYTDQHYAHGDQTLGHEGVGIVKQLGSMVTKFNVGDRVGFGYFQYACGECEHCIVGNDNYCVKREAFGFANKDQGSFGSAVVWHDSTLFKIPDAIDSASAAPLMCAGATVWTALTMNNARSSDRIGIIGIGGLGHLAIQFAAKMGCEVVAFSSSESKREEALAFGATEYHVLRKDTQITDMKPINHLLITTSFQPSFAQILPFMAPRGYVYPLTVDGGETPIPIMGLISSGVAVQGSAVAPRNRIEEMLRFAAIHNIKPQIMKYPLNKEGIEEAMQAQLDGKLRYRGVLVA